MAKADDLKVIAGGGMDMDSSPETIAPNDYISAQNLRTSGTTAQTANDGTNIENLILLGGSLLPGINDIIGGGKFDDTGDILAFRYNTGGLNQILLYSALTNTYTIIYTDKTDSAGLTLLPLDPQNIVLAILIDKTYAVWWGKNMEVGYCNLNTLASGGYGTILPEDLSLLKPQCPFPPTGTYGDDPGHPANYWYSRLPQFAVQYVNADFNYSAWSTRSKRIVPYQENTPTLGNDVGQNNYIIISVNIGSIRATTINIARQVGGETVWYIIKSVDRSYITALVNTAVNVATEVYEAYNPITNIYEYVSYGNEIPIPIDPNETDLLYDYIWPANAAEKINGNIIALGDWNTLYDRPITPITMVAIGYNPNIGIPVGTNPNPLTLVSAFPGSSGSGAGDHKRNMNITLGGVPQTGDVVIIILADIRTATTTQNFSYTVPGSQAGSLLAVVNTIATKLPASAYTLNGDGTYTIFFTGAPYFGLQVYGVTLAFSGAAVANSIATIVENTSYQLAIEYFDSKQRPFPITTDNTYIVATPSKAQVNGNAVKISVTITNAIAPIGAVTYQIVITKPPIIKILDVIGAVISFKGSWDAKTNTPSLSINTGTIGDTYQITTPDSPADSTYTNLGNLDTYNTGDYLTNVGGSSGTSNGKSYSLLSKNFANLAGNKVLCLSLNPLNLFNQEYAQDGVQTILAYQYAQGDRCTLHSWIDGSGNTNYFNNPCIDVAVLGYDAGTYIVKVENSAALVYSSGNILYNGQQINARNIFFRLYSPALVNQSASAVQNTTEWFEIGEQYNIVNGQHATTKIDIFDGGGYYKTRQFPDGLAPYTNPPIETLSTDLNYSDFYPSQYYSFGRPRTYYDELEKTEQQASIIISQNYILGSKNNGLNRFYPADIYGDGDGQCSSSQGPIQILWQRGDVLVAIQGLNVFYIPVNWAYTVLNDQITGQSISEKLLNNGRYATENVGIGNAKESFWKRYNRGGFIDPYKSLPYELTLSGIDPLSKKMSQYFKSTLQVAYSLGKKLLQVYNDYYEEVILCIQAQGGILMLIPFNDSDWNPNDNFVIVPADVTATPNGANCTASYDNTTGLVTYTPTPGFVGNNAPTFTFNAPGGPYTKNNCLIWTAGTTDVFLFAFAPQTNVPLSTFILSNTISVTGPTIAVPISITDGRYSVNGGAFTSSPGTVSPSDIVQVEVMSSASNLTVTSTTLTIGTTSGTFSVETLPPTYMSAAIDAPYQRNDCPSGESGTTVRVEIAAGAYTSNISQADADAQAQAAAQAEANTTGTCLVNSSVSTLLIDYLTDTTADLCCFVVTTGLSETGMIVTGTAEIPSGPLQLPNDGRDPATCFILSSDKLSTPSPGWRFGINLAYFIQKYTGILTTVKFRVQGRDVSAGAITGSYAGRNITEGVLELVGSPGSMIPAVTFGSSSPVPYSSNIVSGANGTVGTGVGSPILDIEFTLAGTLPTALVPTTY